MSLFIVPEAPVAQQAADQRPDLGELLRLVEGRHGATAATALTQRRPTPARSAPAGLARRANAARPAGDDDAMLRRREDAIGGWAAVAAPPADSSSARTPCRHERSPEKCRTRCHRPRPADLDTCRPPRDSRRRSTIRAQLFMHMPLVTEGIVLPVAAPPHSRRAARRPPWQLHQQARCPDADAAVEDAAAGRTSSAARIAAVAIRSMPCRAVPPRPGGGGIRRERFVGNLRPREPTSYRRDRSRTVAPHPHKVVAALIAVL